MAFAFVATTGSGNDKTLSSTVAMTTSASAAAGDLVVVCVAKDNIAAVTGATSEVTSVTDSVGGNTWTKASEYTNAGGAAGGGATVAMFFSVLTNALPTSSTITANLSANVTAKGIRALKFTIGAGSTVAVEGTPAVTSGSSTSAHSMTVSSLSNVEHLSFRPTAVEGIALTGLTQLAQSGWTSIGPDGTSGSTSTTNMQVDGLFQVTTASTSVTCNPTQGATGDCAMMLVTLKETASSNVTVGITGQALAAAGGSVTGTTAKAVSGQSVSVAGGTVTASISADVTVALTGQAITVSRGSLVAATTKALSGQGLAGSAGSVLTATAKALTGQSLVAARGSVTGASSLALSGQTNTVTRGTLAPTASAGISGQAATIARGTVVPDATRALTGQSVSSGAGSLLAALSVGVSSNALAAAQGTITAAIPMDVTVALTGLSVSARFGTLAVEVWVVTPATVPGEWPATTPTQAGWETTPVGPPVPWEAANEDTPDWVSTPDDAPAPWEINA